MRSPTMDGVLSEDLSTILNPSCPSLAADAPFRLDEGYSEDTRSLDDGDSAMGLEPRTSSAATILETLHNIALNLDERQRSEHAYQVLRTLKTSSIAAIVELLTPLLHIDPVGKLPPELTSQIFSYLTPSVLLEASKVSKSWRARTLDSRLWKQKFISEGWVLDGGEIAKFERNYYSQGNGSKSLSRKAETQDSEPRAKKRATNREEGGAMILHDGSRESQSQHQTGNPVPGHSESQDDVMSGVEVQRSPDTYGGPEWTHSLGFAAASTGAEPMLTDEGSSSDSDVGFQDPLVMPVGEKSVRVNFHHVYKQRRRLEENWSAGRYKSFQLPHKDTPEEAHSECVYTVQYSGKYLVSGSRDRTLRIWDLDTQRLIQRPLSGHNGSVLCLQFDERPHEDVIISGSSDTDVIVWQFSTGKLLKRITNAHSESVLNLKFDHRYLVTCSKDKMIKVWNRRALRPGDEDYPIKGVSGGAKFPSYILDLTRTSPRDMEQHFTPEQLVPVPEYSLIMRIDSHSAAVNAVHIHRDQLVSASGDRDVKVFDIHTGVNTALCKGHNKGIACVQYDGKRIVSGSSDDTIRIFDPVSQLEIACLQGHTKLVRTVQAAYGDQPGTEEDLEQEAKAVDQAFVEAARRGDISANTSRHRVSRERNAGSRRPQDITAVGAKLPPGGGGSPWARIVSGSYDETVIIWRKANDGRWIPGHRLKQAEALTAAGGPLIARSERQNLAQIAAQQAAQQVQAAAAPLVAATGGASMIAALNLPSNGASAAQAPNTNPTLWPQGFGSIHPLQQPTHQNPAAHLHQNQAPAHGPAPVPAVNFALPIHMQHHPQNARVFKLQFDARRIICCSQDPKIVGWDFANEDEEIIECSKFFGPPT